MLPVSGSQGFCSQAQEAESRLSSRPRPALARPREGGTVPVSQLVFLDHGGI